MERAATIDDLTAVAAKEIRAISGFDRVMVYRFDEDWHGIVLAEDVSDRYPIAYAGMHFPASDIPVQARELYVLNTLRLIPDTIYTPVPIVNATGVKAPLDLSRSELRSVSPIHLEYLQNIGVRATLTISILVRGKLWGLVACHHATPRPINHAVRSTCNFFAHMLALKLKARIDRTMLTEQLASGEALAKFVATLESTRSLHDALADKWRDLAPIFGADGLLFDGPEGTAVYGTAAAPHELRTALEALRATADDGIAGSSSLTSIDPAAEAFAADVSGVLYVSLSPNHDRCLLFLRPEQRATVTWAGDPNKAIVAEPGRTRLSPRGSFAAWEQITHGDSTRWTERDLRAARALREQLIDWQQAREQICLLAHYDDLTKLPDRRLLVELLRRALSEAEAMSTIVGLLFIDVDRFKRFNARLGNAAGDSVLRHVAVRISQAVRDCDIVSRLGGDRFAVIMPALPDRAAAAGIAERLHDEISRPMPDVHGHDLRVTLSIGISVYPDDARTSEALLNRADAAMSEAKANGRSARHEYDAVRVDARDAGDERAACIARALDRGEIVAHFQPIVDLDTGRVCAVEALARWNHPVDGLLGPGAFIDIAEQSDLIVRLGETMLDLACGQVARWRATTAPDLRVAVNVSPRQLRDFGFARTVQRLLAGHRLSPSALEIEITEGMMIDESSQSINTLRELADSGVRIAIDDFGSGYSSFSYLRKLTVRTLKIDQSFIAELDDPTTRANGSAIIQAIVAVAKSLQLEVIAEGVESQAQLDALRVLGCDLVQGYFLGRPQAASAYAEFASLLAPTAGCLPRTSSTSAAFGWT